MVKMLIVVAVAPQAAAPQAAVPLAVAVAPQAVGRVVKMKRSEAAPCSYTTMSSVTHFPI